MDPGAQEWGNLQRGDLELVSEADTLVNQSKGDESEIQTWADAKLMRSELCRITGTISGPGIAAIACGELVEIVGINDRLNGKAFVRGVRHEIAGGTWLTDIQLGISDEFFLESEHSPSKANPLLPGIQNLYAGITLALEEDPFG